MDRTTIADTSEEHPISARRDVTTAKRALPLLRTGYGSAPSSKVVDSNTLNRELIGA